MQLTFTHLSKPVQHLKYMDTCYNSLTESSVLLIAFAFSFETGRGISAGSVSAFHAAVSRSIVVFPAHSFVEK